MEYVQFFPGRAGQVTDSSPVLEYGEWWRCPGCMSAYRPQAGPMVLKAQGLVPLPHVFWAAGEGGGLCFDEETAREAHRLFEVDFRDVKWARKNLGPVKQLITPVVGPAWLDPLTVEEDLDASVERCKVCGQIKVLQYGWAPVLPHVFDHGEPVMMSPDGPGDFVAFRRDFAEFLHAKTRGSRIVEFDVDDGSVSIPPERAATAGTISFPFDPTIENHEPSSVPQLAIQDFARCVYYEEQDGGLWLANDLDELIDVRLARLHVGAHWMGGVVFDLATHQRYGLSYRPTRGVAFLEHDVKGPRGQNTGGWWSDEAIQRRISRDLEKRRVPVAPEATLADLVKVVAGLPDGAEPGGRLSQVWGVDRSRVEAGEKKARTFVELTRMIAGRVPESEAAQQCVVDAEQCVQEMAEAVSEIAECRGRAEAAAADPSLSEAERVAVFRREHALREAADDRFDLLILETNIIVRRAERASLEFLPRSPLSPEPPVEDNSWLEEPAIAVENETETPAPAAPVGVEPIVFADVFERQNPDRVQVPLRDANVFAAYVSLDGRATISNTLDELVCDWLADIDLSIDDGFVDMIFDQSGATFTMTAPDEDTRVLTPTGEYLDASMMNDLLLEVIENVSPFEFGDPEEDPKRPDPQTATTAQLVDYIYNDLG